MKAKKVIICALALVVFYLGISIYANTLPVTIISTTAIIALTFLIAKNLEIIEKSGIESNYD